VPDQMEGIGSVDSSDTIDSDINISEDAIRNLCAVYLETLELWNTSPTFRAMVQEKSRLRNALAFLRSYDDGK